MRTAQADALLEVEVYNFNAVPGFTSGTVPAAGTYPPQFDSLMAANTNKLAYMTFAQVPWYSTCPLTRESMVKSMDAIDAIVSACLVIMIFGILASATDGHFILLACKTGTGPACGSCCLIYFCLGRCRRLVFLLLVSASPLGPLMSLLRPLISSRVPLPAFCFVQGPRRDGTFAAVTGGCLPRLPSSR